MAKLSRKQLAAIFAKARATEKRRFKANYDVLSQGGRDDSFARVTARKLSNEAGFRGAIRSKAWRNSKQKFYSSEETKKGRAVYLRWLRMRKRKRK